MSAATRVDERGLAVLLDHLEGVQRSGSGYRARCPSCGGRSRKVSIAETAGGTVLVHAFCGCSPVQVLDAIGLTLAALFPQTPRATTTAERREAHRAWRVCQWGGALEVLVFEATVALIAARQIAMGEPLNAEDDARLALAVTRLTDAREVLRGR
jgi:hypothetical protein